MASAPLQARMLDQAGAHAEDFAGCWKSCGGICCHYNCVRDNDMMCNFVCMPVIPFPVCRCVDRDGDDPLVWKSRSDWKGNSETWNMVDKDTIKVENHNRCTGSSEGSDMTRCCG
mmetsp:Transcript_106191/g.300298  ORF Transcript_106191/g.300298 Transcript_106191/m.300298 type:complete len:115 (-) Transcript_106191:23-367(-)|eukprot:CAMPEP_0168378544 /NCGR_PEP_ID=MMETSP0228-20121227/11391_1 /TAXON_ID=133427 /ORGANISM="Protoceratium reticulatum, Strain CCCM 535 (=CCMP 1889)" /LENGTH=114 /DNA_ID=CAMNT_0008391565 /DNA_START=67 /DNA_END=411 /DNA_ORIENTATION=-